VAAVINMTPGPDTMLVLRASIAGGRSAGLVSAAGITIGCLIWGVAAATGVTGLLAASRLAYDTVRIAGAIYLAWLGAQALWQARHLVPDVSAETSAEPQAPKCRLFAFRSGLMTNLLNPKAGVFYMSLVPQFIPHGAPVFGTALLLTALDVAELVIWFAVLSAVASGMAGRIHRPAFRRRMEQASGVVLLGFAADLALDRGTG